MRVACTRCGSGGRESAAGRGGGAGQPGPRALSALCILSSEPGVVLERGPQRLGAGPTVLGGLVLALFYFLVYVMFFFIVGRETIKVKSHASPYSGEK